ncbi:hypothetical protein QR680_009321 [Steinernema hermaphroditum]|uniref:non-specific serine/threonine protein kinase n=1 Tax=Steinernema hermaphroditum TaxID=289476 RepID=A0AA39ILY2_9BILA|nr:hypothetical protein QR680_009321 [Steinernema hermaphroditum]
MAAAIPRAHQGKPKEAIRGKNAPQFLHNGVVLNGRYRVERMIGGGGFGQIYKAVEGEKGRTIAIKVEPVDNEPSRMILEQKVLNMLRGSKHIPLLVASGTFQDCMFIAMEMLGANLCDIRKKRVTRRLSVATVLRVGEQAVEALKIVHDTGYLHRDIKPSNMCVGLASTGQQRTIFLVDFGMTRRFRSEAGSFRKERVYAGFRGTLRYVSLTVHDRREQGPVDDLWSLLYSIIELGEGGLPWKNLVDPDDIARKKENTPFRDMCRHLPRGIRDVPEYLSRIAYNQIPDYAKMVKILKENYPKGSAEDETFDWEYDESMDHLVNS